MKYGGIDMYNIKDKYFERIAKKIEDGTFERGIY